VHLKLKTAGFINPQHHNQERFSLWDTGGRLAVEKAEVGEVLADDETLSQGARGVLNALRDS
jgi:hypothetical protein